MSADAILEPSAPIGKFRGAPVVEMPADLYIPPDALEIFLDTFEGPLDLLLYLIRRNNVDVLEIAMAPLTVQYLEYVEIMRRRSLELAAEYLVMAAVLLEIKSRMLLPRPPAGHAVEEDPRAELVRRLLAYEQMKLAALRLDRLPQAGRDFSVVNVWLEQGAVKALPKVSAEDLRQAWLSLLSRATAHQHHKLVREQLSVRAHMSAILRRLQEHEHLEFVQLFTPAEGVPTLVVTLLAILELTRETLVEVTQQAAYAPIHVKLIRGLTVV